MSTESDITAPERATCRGCRMELNGKAYHLGGLATHPRTGETCRINFYGGYVCSWECDRAASMELQSSMPGAGPCRSLDGPAMDSLRRNWPESRR